MSDIASIRHDKGTYRVGEMGVDKITYEVSNFGDYGIGMFRIHDGDDIVAEVNHRYVVEITRFAEVVDNG